MKNTRGLILMTVGGLLLTAALALTVYNVAEDRRAEHTAWQTLAAVEAVIPQLPQTPEEDLPEAVYDTLTDREMPEREVDGNSYIGKLELPTLDIVLPVMSQWSYSNLKLAPCRYMGSAYRDDMILAAHNYASHFGRLKELPVGAPVVFTDMDGRCFTYTVAQVETLGKRAVEEMEAGDWDLTLFTCTLSGESRVTVRCTREK